MKRVSTFFLYAAAAALFQIATAPGASAAPILGSNLATFAILGGAGVTLDGIDSTVTGNVGGCCNASDVTGQEDDDIIGTVYESSVVSGPAFDAQAELGTAILALNNMTPDFTGLSTLGAPGPGQTLVPGVYAASSDLLLTGTLNLDGGDNANALWVFQVGGALTIAAGSVVNLINTGPNAGVYWVSTPPSGTSAVLTSTVVLPTTVVGNFLFNASISLAPGVTNSCGGFYTQTESVTLAGVDTIGIGCAGGGEIVIVPGEGGGPTVVPLPYEKVPEPGTLLLLGTGIVGLVVRRRRPARA